MKVIPGSLLPRISPLFSSSSQQKTETTKEEEKQQTTNNNKQQKSEKIERILKTKDETGVGTGAIRNLSKADSGMLKAHILEDYQKKINHEMGLKVPITQIFRKENSIQETGEIRDEPDLENGIEVIVESIEEQQMNLMAHLDTIQDTFVRFEPSMEQDFADFLFDPPTQPEVHQQSQTESTFLFPAPSMSQSDDLELEKNHTAGFEGEDLVILILLTRDENLIKTKTKI